MARKIRVAILDDHPLVISGYYHELRDAPEIEVVGEATSGDELEQILANHPVDVMLMDISVPVSQDNPNPYPILHVVPKLLETYPDLSILAISMYNGRTLIKAAVEAGVSGYIIKDDKASTKNLSAIITSISNGGAYFSEQARQKLFKDRANNRDISLSPRELEALSLAAAHPNDSSADLAKKLNIVHSTVRNTLSNAYEKLGINNRAAAILEAQRMGLIPTPPSAHLEDLRKA